MRPTLEILSYGPPGTGKSTFASTAPKPGLTFAFDPYGKTRPYLDLGHEQPVQYLLATDDFAGIPYRDVLDDDGNLIWRVEYYLNVDPVNPQAWPFYEYRIACLMSDHAALQALSGGTLVLDSATSFEMSFRKWEQHVNNPNYKDPRKWYGASKDTLEQEIWIRLPSLATYYGFNVIVICHEDYEKEEFSGMFLRNPLLPGKLSRSIASQYPEQYYHNVAIIDGQLRYTMQTSVTPTHMAQTHINAPNPCSPTWDALWTNWDAKYAAKTPPKKKGKA